MRGREAEARPGRGRAWSEPETSREAQKIPGCRLRLSMTLGVSAPALLQGLAKKACRDRQPIRVEERPGADPRRSRGLECYGGGEKTLQQLVSRQLAHPYGKDKVDPYLRAGLQISSR